MEWVPVGKICSCFALVALLPFTMLLWSKLCLMPSFALRFMLPNEPAMSRLLSFYQTLCLYLTYLTVAEQLQSCCAVLFGRIFSLICSDGKSQRRQSVGLSQHLLTWELNPWEKQAGTSWIPATLHFWPLSLSVVWAHASAQVDLPVVCRWIRTYTITVDITLKAVGLS